MNYKIYGDVMQYIVFTLDNGESVMSEPGAMIFMSDNVELKTEMKGGLGAGISRALAGESLFLSTFTCNGGNGMVAFAVEVPGRLVPMQLKPGQSIMCQKDCYLVSSPTIDIKMEFTQRFGAGLLGGAGFFLQKITGPGMLFLSMGGNIIEYTLKPDQMLKIDTGCIGAFEPTVAYDIQRLPGIKNMFFGGEGIFLATLKGPGKVWLQSMPTQTLAKAVGKYIVRGR